MYLVTFFFNLEENGGKCGSRRDLVVMDLFIRLSHQRRERTAVKQPVSAVLL